MIEGIPTQFQCLGRTVKIKWVDEIKDASDGSECWGETCMDSGTISLVKPSVKENVDQEMLKQVFWHETVHFILLSLNDRELGYDEQFVDRMAACIHQILKSSKYPRKRSPKKPRKIKAK